MSKLWHQNDLIEPLKGTIFSFFMQGSACCCHLKLVSFILYEEAQKWMPYVKLMICELLNWEITTLVLTTNKNKTMNILT